MKYRKHTVESIKNCTILCKTKKEFKQRFPTEWFFAKRTKIMKEVCSHMINGRRKWFRENLAIEAKKYTNRWAFQQGSKGAYLAAFNMRILDGICAHMDKLCRNPYNEESLKEIIAKCESIGDFKKYYQAAYKICCQLGLLKKLAGHLKRKCKFPFTNEELFAEAKIHDNRRSFKEKSNSVYNACRYRGILKEACTHMKRTKAIGSQEAIIFDTLYKDFPDIVRYRDYHVKIMGKPHFQHLEIDMLIPSLNKGIEFDGKWYHSYECMKKDKYKKYWPDEDVLNYHSIKDAWFASKGIQILHIKEEDWENNKSRCIAQIEDFLEITDFMSENGFKAA